MKKMKNLLTLTLCFALVVSAIPFVCADNTPSTTVTFTDIGEPLVEEVYNIPANIEAEPYYANRLQVCIRGEEHPQRKIYTVEDFPEISDYLVGIDEHEIGTGGLADDAPPEWDFLPGPTRTIFMTTTTTTRSDLMIVLKKLETSPIVRRVIPVCYRPVMTCDAIPNGAVLGNYVDSADALYVLQKTIGKVEFTDKQYCYGDMDGDEEITSADALLILQTIVGKVEKKFDGYQKWTLMLLSDNLPEVMHGEI